MNAAVRSCHSISLGCTAKMSGSSPLPRGSSPRSPPGLTASDWRLSLRRNTFGRKRLALRIADADEVIDPDAQLAGHRRLLLSKDRQRLQDRKRDAGLQFQCLVVEPEAGSA